ncbi:alpha-glucan phosphorylase [Anoxybacter fermentans]|uniref:glycogen phosphorylase n=1 Tax=Anoxybacter fermentans TaxID=1323375 RepID=A0A3Q9HNJ5_9FIRM|nr:alpha-glucan family phosphorylase [Anoxybacter fermentans]AZR72022.1 alpha-glucan phosphorylase [Anoxybacter fermentans]
MKETQKLPRVAYFCMEYGLHEEFHLYAGGLGILAGDHLKAAKDLDLPLVGIGLLWRQGYTRQLIGEDGKPYDCYHNYEYDFLKDTGVTVSVKIRGEEVKAKVWKVDKYGNAPLYLLDTNLPDNPGKWITGQLYGGFSETRIAQEMILGIGGVRALRKLGIDVDVYHFNEGHAALAGLELIREKMEKGLSFEEAWEKTRKEIVFTTHTPVKAGNESHSLETLIYMGANNGLTLDQMVQIGGAPFNMTVAGLRLSRIANAVAQLHGQTARKMWADVKDSAPIIAITNGVHHGTWVDPRIQKNLENDDDLWNAHMEIKKECIGFIKERTGVELNPDALLIGFARRAAPYKRSDLIFTNPEVIDPLLKDGKIQIVFSGKAHPLDDTGKAIVANLVKMMKKYPKSVVFIENYDISIGRMLTRGTDVWLNNPRRPMEASGTSGMKAAMNGVLNLSTLDGWWPEACEHGVNGWQFGDGYEGEGQDEHDLRALYKVLLEEVVPTYYEDRAKWIKMMRASIKSTYEKFSATRMVKEYYERLYTNR